MKRGKMIRQITTLMLILVFATATAFCVAEPSPSPQAGPPPSLQQKMQHLGEVVGRLQEQGVNPQPVGDIMQGFQPLMDQQKYAEAEAVLDQALKRASELAPAGAPQEGLPMYLRRKMQRLQAVVNQRQQEGWDVQPVHELMQGFPPLIQQQRWNEAEALLDKALKYLNAPTSITNVAAPGDASLIAWGARDDDGRQQIFVARADSTVRKALTHEGDQNFFPAWSPDGKKLAFTSNRTGSLQIWVTDASGGNPTQLTKEGDNVVPTWSLDGKQVAFGSKRTGHFEIWVMNADGSGQKQLTKTDDKVGNNGAAWSPGGKHIAFSSTRSGHYAIWVIDPDGAHPSQLTFPYGDRYPDANAPAWSPDGKKIAFWSGLEHRYGNVFVMDADGSNRKQLTDQPAGINCDEPAWSPDGKKIIYATNRPGSDGIGNWIMNADGSDQKVLHTNTYIRGRISWQPGSHPATAASPAPATSGDARDGKHGLIALTLRDAAMRLQIFTILPDGTSQKQLTFEGDNGRPEWSPDGTKIVFASIRDGKPLVGVMAADGSSQKMLTTGKAPCWSRDGRRIAFARDGQIWVMDADGSNIRQITNSDTVKSGPSWSPDDKQLIFILTRNPGSQTDPQPQIGIMNSDGTNERILTTQQRSNLCRQPDGSETFLATAHDTNAPAWSPVDNRIAFWSGIERHYGEVWIMNADGSGTTQVTKECTRRNNDDPSWSPDGKKILFSTGRSGRNELWIINPDGTGERKISDIEAYPFPGRASWQPLR